MINVLADKHIYKIEDFLPSNIHLTLFDSNKPLDEIPADTEALLIRSVTKINDRTFPELPQNLSFAATASAGTDHVDIEYLQNNEITFTNARGCNARSVAEYVTVALLLWADQTDKKLPNHRVGIIGAGHTGSAVENLLQRLGIETVAYDPPRQEREGGYKSASMSEVLKCDILTFHTPLTHHTNYSTYHWLGKEKLKQQEFSLVINASRGGVIAEKPLLKAYQSGTVENYILDVWENEPDFSDEVARRAFLKTPHIAGYSVQAKERATQMIVEAMARHFGIDTTIKEINTSAQSKPTPTTFWSLTDALTHYHPIDDYKTRLMMLVGRSSEEKVAGFREIRTHHPLRDELHCIKMPNELLQKFPALKVLAS